MTAAPARPPAATRYAVAAAAVGLCGGVRQLLDPVLGEHHPFALFLAAAYLAAWRGGPGPGLAALALGLAAADLLFIHPRGSLGPATPAQWVGLAVYAAVGGGSVALLAALGRGRARAVAQAERLADEVVDRRMAQEEALRAVARLERRVTELEAALDLGGRHPPPHRHLAAAGVGS